VPHFSRSFCEKVGAFSSPSIERTSRNSIPRQSFAIHLVPHLSKAQSVHAGLCSAKRVCDIRPYAAVAESGGFIRLLTVGSGSARITAMNRRTLLAIDSRNSHCWPKPLPPSLKPPDLLQTAVFELRGFINTYEGKARGPAIPLFAKHTTQAVREARNEKTSRIGLPRDDPLKGKTLIYVISHARPGPQLTCELESLCRGIRSGSAFRDKSEANGKLVEKVDSTFMVLTDFFTRSVICGTGFLVSGQPSRRVPCSSFFGCELVLRLSVTRHGLSPSCFDDDPGPSSVNHVRLPAQFLQCGRFAALLVFSIFPRRRCTWL